MAAATVADAPASLPSHPLAINRVVRVAALIAMGACRSTDPVDAADPLALAPCDETMHRQTAPIGPAFGARYVAVDEANVYWNIRTPAFVPKTGGQARFVDSRMLLPEEFLAEFVPGGIAVDDTHVYFSAVGIYRVPKEGGVIEDVVSGGGHEIALDDGHVYYVGGGSISRSLKEFGFGLEPPLYENPDPAGAAFLVLDGDYLYWTETETGRILRMRKDGETPEEVIAEIDGVMDIVADDTHLYVAQRYTRAIYRMAKDGSDLDLLFQGDYSVYLGLFGLALDDEHVYWPDGDQGAIHVMRKDGQGHERISLQGDGNHGYGVAVDDDAVYWVTATSSGMVYRMCK